MNGPHDLDEDLPVNLASQRFAVIPPINADAQQCYPLAPKPPETPRLRASRPRKKKKRIFPPSLMTDINLKENFCLDVLPQIGETRTVESPPPKIVLHERNDNQGSERRLCQKIDRSETEIIGFEIHDGGRLSQSSEDEFVLNCEDVNLTPAQRSAIEALNRLEETMIAISRPSSKAQFQPRPPTRKNPTRRGNRNFTPKPPQEACEEDTWKDPRIERLKQRAMGYTDIGSSQKMHSFGSTYKVDKATGNDNSGGIIKMAGRNMYDGGDVGGGGAYLY